MKYLVYVIIEIRITDQLDAFNDWKSEACKGTQRNDSNSVGILVKTGKFSHIRKVKRGSGRLPKFAFL